MYLVYCHYHILCTHTKERMKPNEIDIDIIGFNKSISECAERQIRRFLFIWTLIWLKDVGSVSVKHMGYLG